MGLRTRLTARRRQERLARRARRIWRGGTALRRRGRLRLARPQVTFGSPWHVGPWRTGHTHRSCSMGTHAGACRGQMQQASLQVGCMLASWPLGVWRGCTPLRMQWRLCAAYDNGFPCITLHISLVCWIMHHGGCSGGLQSRTLSPVVPGEAPAAAALPAKRAKPAAPKPAKKARRAEEGSADPGERDGPGEPPEPTEYARNRPRREVSRDRDQGGPKT